MNIVIASVVTLPWLGGIAGAFSLVAWLLWRRRKLLTVLPAPFAFLFGWLAARDLADPFARDARSDLYVWFGYALIALPFAVMLILLFRRKKISGPSRQSTRADGPHR